VDELPLLAAIMPDFRYRQTTATLDVRGFAFRAAGRQPIDLGWRAAFPDWQPVDEKGDDAQLLPALRNGEIARLENPTIEDKEIRPRDDVEQLFSSIESRGQISRRSSTVLTLGMTAWWLAPSSPVS
jgi:DNA topoisomerase IA